MALVAIIFSSFVGTCAAIVSLLLGFGVYASVTVYFSAVFAVLATVAAAAFIARSVSTRPKGAILLNLQE
ncbi:MAG: hypothetical protein AAGF27_10045 [Pseudomonadota bacterium]